MTTTLTRRTALKSAAAVGATVAAHSRLSTAAAASAGRSGSCNGRLVVLFLRGGQDHLSTVIPYGNDGNWRDFRPTIAVPENEMLDLDGTFGLHPAMTQLHALYGQGRLAPVVAAGNPAGDRSHFLAQDLWEYGDTELPADGYGWLARHLHSTPSPEDTPFRAVAVGNNVTKSFAGYPALGLPALQLFGLGGSSGATSTLRSVFELAYAGAEVAERVGQQALDAADVADGLTPSSAANPVTRAFEDIAVLLAAEIGVETVTVNIGGWDTHAGMGDTASGEMRDLLAGLDGYLGAFQADLDSRGLGDVVTVVMTEFGRRVYENGSGGTDHGFAAAMLVLGDRVNGGQVHGSFPSLAASNIAPRNDVPVGTDFRDVLGDIVANVLGADPADVFTGHSYAPVGVA